ncbi:MAG: MBL fold metallo-hydrolase [Candidatus Sericytochromatia bacterium]|nr:MBL fold metallo-hydrolase [Candidatus Sericytochromatia bacterium]
MHGRLMGWIGLLSGCASVTGVESSAVLPRIGSAWVADTGYVRAFALDAGADAGVVLIDAGNEKDAAALMRVLAAMGRTAADVSAIFLTHGHVDHLAGCEAFPRAQVLAMGAEVPLIQGEVEARSPFGRSPLGCFFRPDGGLRVSRGLSDKEVTRIGDLRIEAHAVPGHTDGTAAYLVGPLLFLGDAAYAGADGRLEGPRWFFSHDTEQGTKALAALARRLDDRPDLELSWLVPSHTPALQGVAALRAWVERAPQHERTLRGLQTHMTHL